MAIFLDYYKPRKENISDVAVMVGSRVKFYRYRAIPEMINELAGRELIVVFEKPFRSLLPVMQGYEHLIEDHNIRKRWYDLHVVLRQETGKALSLSKIVDATLGTSDDMKISRLEPALESGIRLDLDLKMTTRLNALQEIFKYALKFDQLSYKIGGSTEWVELNINENIDID